MLAKSSFVSGINRTTALRWRPSPISMRQLASPACGQVRSHWSDRLPIIIRPSFWGQLYPGIAKKIRGRREAGWFGRRGERKKGWNPATYFIWMALLIGSQSINLILLKNEWEVFTRKADAKIALLKEVIEKVHRGEDVDVERMLGTGDESHEREWKEVLEEVEHEDRLWQSKQRKRERRAARRAEKEAQAREAREAAEKAPATEGMP